MKWYLEVLKKYAVFRGRARRQEFWYFTLFSMLISIGLIIIDAIYGFTFGPGLSVLTLLYSLGIWCPSIAVGMRRLHDTNRSGWWTLLYLLPFIGTLILIVFFATDGTPGQNSYGPSPKPVDTSTLGLNTTE